MKIYNLYLVTDRDACLGRSLEEVVKQAVRGGVTMVQLREKVLETRYFIEEALRLKQLLQPYHVPLIINDRVDVALAAGADGVHIGQRDMPYTCVRQITHDKMIIGLSVENMQQALEAEHLDVDYLGVSPVFATPTKTDFEEKPWGLEGLLELRKVSRHKLIAIGGINASNAATVINAGADGVAVVSAVCSAGSPEKASAELTDIIKTAKYKL